jgi:hypothetical protein
VQQLSALALRQRGVAPDLAQFSHALRMAFTSTGRKAITGVLDRCSCALSANRRAPTKTRSEVFGRKFGDQETAQFWREVARLITFFDVCSPRNFFAIETCEIL